MIPVCIFCGGSGTRLREMTDFLPKPMIPIGPYPIVTHIIKHYQHYGYTDFILMLGFKQEKFKEYFAHYDIINNDITVDIGRGVNRHGYSDRGLRITLCDTGVETLKGERLRRVEKYVHGDTFLLTYGDAVSDINLWELVEFHQAHGKIGTVTGVRRPPRFGELVRYGSQVTLFSEKAVETDCLINGGYFVFDRRIFDYLEEGGDFEIGALERLAIDGELMVYEHNGYWKCCDMLKDLNDLQKAWESGAPEWKVW